MRFSQLLSSPLPFRSGVLPLFGSLALSAAAYAAPPAYTLAAVENGMQLKTPEGKVVFEYKTKIPEGIGLQSPSAAYFDPVNTPAGERVSNAAPDDHPWHRGIFFAPIDSEFRFPLPVSKAAVDPNDYRIPPSRVPGAFNPRRGDFWSWGFYSPREDRVIQNRDIRLVTADAKHAQLEIHNDWLITKRKMMEETDEVFVTERDGVYVIDLVYRLAPVVDWVIKKQGFGGFDVQAQKVGDSYYSNASGKVTDRPPPHYSVPESDWPAEPWYDYSIKLKSDGKLVGVAVIDHPMNPPTRWHNELWMVNPCIMTYEDLTVHPDAPLVLRYRVVMHDGAPPTDLLQTLAVEWRGNKETGLPPMQGPAVATQTTPAR